MKTGKSKFLTAAFFGFFVLLGIGSCSSEESPDCLEVEIIGSEDCIDFLLGIVKNREDFGTEVLYYDGVTYHNVVRMVARESYSAGETIYIHYREYNRDTDYDIFGRTPKICPAVVGFYNVPTYVATRVNKGACP